MRSTSIMLSCLLALSGPLPGPLSAQESVPAFDQSFVTKHAGIFNKQRVKYTATIEPTVLTDAKGAPSVRFVTTAYTRDDVKDRSARPVIFIWGGGPSAASTVLQMRLYGPRIATISPIGREADYEPELVDNPDCVLDVADLVFVDPPESGFSRILPDGSRAYYYSVEGDTRAIADFIEHWLKRHGREDSPRYVHGQSYGSVRAIQVARNLSEKRPVDGIIITGNSAMMLEAERRDSIVGFALSVPTMAVGAVAHGWTDRRGRDDRAIVDESYKWAIDEYLPALAQVQDLAPERKQALAARLSDYSGLSADYFLSHDLAVPRDEWRTLMGKQHGITPNRSDVRRTAALPSAEGPTFVQLMTKELGVTYSMKDYRSGAPDTDNWNFGPPDRLAGNDWRGMLLNQMIRNPKERYLSINGFHDATSIVGSVRYLFGRTALPKDRVVVREYIGGHSIYTYEPTRIAVLNDIRAFVTKGPAQ